MKLLKYFSQTLLFFNVVSAQGHDKLDSRFSFSMYMLHKGGINFSASYGFWKTTKYLQPAANISTIFSVGKNHLGNNYRNGTKFQWNIVISPMITSTLNFKNPKKRGIEEEIMTLYLNNSNSVYSSYRSSFTMGSTFITTPKGFGRNYTTNRNRAQQLAFFQLKTAFSKDVIFQANLVEDVGPQFLADKFDRYFTGGGSLQLRYKEFKLKAMSEIYTGTTTRDIFDYPDVVYPDKPKIGINDKKRGLVHGIKRFFHGGVSREATYALQEPSQYIYNLGRMLWGVDINHSVFEPKGHLSKNLTHSFYFFRQGGSEYDPNKSTSMGPMWSQNIIHGLGTNDVLKVIRDESNSKKSHPIPFKVKGDRTNFLEPKHWFEPYPKKVTSSFGYGLNYYYR